MQPYRAEGFNQPQQISCLLLVQLNQPLRHPLNIPCDEYEEEDEREIEQIVNDSARDGTVIGFALENTAVTKEM